MIIRSFDKVAELNGNFLTYDGLHETSRGAAMIEDLLSGFLENEINANKCMHRYIYMNRQ